MDPKKRSREKFPGQVERALFSLEQVKTLASSIRTEVFWSFDEFEPMSAADVGAAMGKSAQTIHYHVHELVKVGLLIAVGTRKRRARTETLYVHSARSFFAEGPNASAEYRGYIRKSFTSITRQMDREQAGMHDVLNFDPSIKDFHGYLRASLRLTPEAAQTLKSRLHAVLQSAHELEVEGEGHRVVASIYLSPTLAESRLWLKRVAKPKSTPKLKRP